MPLEIPPPCHARFHLREDGRPGYIADVTEHTVERNEMNQLPETGYLRLKQIIGDPANGIQPIIPVGKTSWWEGVRSGRYPKPVKLGPRTTVWRAEDIRNLIDRGADAA